MKIVTVVGTRPELIKMSRVIAKFDSHTDHVLVHTGQNFDYDLNEVFFSDLGIRNPDYHLDIAGDNVASSIANVIQRSDEVFDHERPDAVLIYGDTNSGLAAISAKRRKIPIFHMEAGNRCYDQRVPEEINRKIIDHTSDINLVLTEHARRNLMAEGIKPDTILKTGSHMFEVLDYYSEKIEASSALGKLNLSPGGYILISAHREENLDSESNFGGLLKSIDMLFEVHNLPIIVSTHPRTRKKLDADGYVNRNPNIRFLNPFGFIDYVSLQKGAKCVLSDSGTIAEEASLLDLPAVMIRNSHERPEAFEGGGLVLSRLQPEEILAAVNCVMQDRVDCRRRMPNVPDYLLENVSSKILKIVYSYTEYVNRTVWYK